MSLILLCHSPPHALTTGSLTEPGGRLAASKPTDPPVSVPTTWSYPQDHSELFNVGPGESNSGLYVCKESIPHPDWPSLNSGLLLSFGTLKI